MFVGGKFSCGVAQRLLINKGQKTRDTYCT